MRRVLVVGLVGGAVVGGVTVAAMVNARRNAAGKPQGKPDWVPLTLPVTEPAPAPEVPFVPPDIDGGCPDSHPIKANRTSQIFHSPGGQSYNRTRADRCYCDATAAEADGYRRAKR